MLKPYKFLFCICFITFIVYVTQRSGDFQIVLLINYNFNSLHGPVTPLQVPTVSGNHLYDNGTMAYLCISFSIIQQVIN